MAEAEAEAEAEAVTGIRTPRRVERRSVGGAGTLGSKLVVAAQRDRVQLLSAAVVTLAILAVLTSWGALDLGGAAAEPAPIIISSGTD
jgi:hypothetical protein